MLKGGGGWQDFDVTSLGKRSHGEALEPEEHVEHVLGDNSCLRHYGDDSNDKEEVSTYSVISDIFQD